MTPQDVKISDMALLRAVTASALKTLGLLRLSSQPSPSLRIPPEFIGVNVAPADDPSVRDYTLERLSELGIRQVRLDFTYGSAEGPAGAYLEQLLEAGYEVLLNVFPSPEDARRMHDSPAARERFAAFAHTTFERFAGRVAVFEIGNTPNRGKWSGFSSRSFLSAWSAAAAQAGGFDARLAGPNVSDFEPLFNGTYLRLMARSPATPDIHTDNLFVERVIEPEALDHRVMGRLLARPMALNLVKKARILEALGRAEGVGVLQCSYVCWTSKRLQRRSVTPQMKAVDYLVRYLVLAASSGALARVYWGPLVCNRDGLIDDKTVDYPEVDQVSHYEKVRGNIDDFDITPAFAALTTAVQRLPGAHCRSLIHQVDGLSVFALDRQGEPPSVVAWCRDAMTWPLSSILTDAQLVDATFTSARGELMPRPLVVTEHPLFIDLAEPLTDLDSRAIAAAARTHIAHLSSDRHQSVSRDVGSWRGAVMLRADSQRRDLEAASALEPGRIEHLEETRVMRDVRNRLWNVDDPGAVWGQVTVKLNRVKGIKRLSYRFRPSKGRRHWNNACRMWRCGVATPLPIAYYEQAEKPGIQDSWYLCEFIPDAFSCRDVYAAFRDGAVEFQGLDKAAWFELLSGFICNMHNKQIVHRDLSAGNLLLQRVQGGELQPCVIDIGRARVWPGPGSRVRPRHRLQDLMRICYKLDWPDRQAFIGAYESHNGSSLGRFWKLPFRYYDFKQAFKKSLKGKRRKSSRTGSR